MEMNECDCCMNEKYNKCNKVASSHPKKYLKTEIPRWCPGRKKRGRQYFQSVSMRKGQAPLTTKQFWIWPSSSTLHISVSAEYNIILKKFAAIAAHFFKCAI